MTLLDVGCGPGTITVGLARAVAPGRVVAIDASEQVIEQARVQAAVPDASVEWEVGDVYDLAFGDGSFDVVHAHQVLQHLADPVAALREMARVAAPGGLVACRDADFAAMSWYPEVPALDRWREVYSAVARANGGEPDAGRHLLAWAHEAGFEDVTASASAWCYATRDERSWWSDLWAERITQTPLAERALELGIATRDDLAELAEGWRRWGAHRDAWFSVPNAEVLCRRR
jgi:ubiquinone/menaquinone biosynthesis C-methylase UbiE